MIVAMGICSTLAVPRPLMVLALHGLLQILVGADPDQAVRSSPLPPAPAGWHDTPLAYPAHYGATGPRLIPGSNNSTLGPCFAACTAAHTTHPSGSLGCLGFTACSSGPVGCWLYSDIGSGALASSPVCDWHSSPWAHAPGPVPPPPPAPAPPPPFPPLPPTPPSPPPTHVVPDWDATLASGVTAIPSYLDQVNAVTMARSSKLHDAVFARIEDLGADHIRYLHWDGVGESTALSPLPLIFSYKYEKSLCGAGTACWPEPTPPSNGKTSWDFSGIDPYVVDFMEASQGHDSVINFAPVARWMTNKTGYIDPTGVQAGEYFSRIISWYTKGGFIDELGVKHVSNHSYAWKYWEVLNEVDAGESGTHCSSLNNSAAAPLCAEKYTSIYDGIVTVLHRDHPELQFTGLVTAWPDCAGSETWFRYFLNASNHRSPVRENFATYVREVSYHWYSENGARLPYSWHTIGANPADIFVQSAQFLVSAKRIKALVSELAPGTLVYCNEIGVLAPDPAEQLDPFGRDRWWWNLEAAQYGYVYGELAALGVDGMAASQLTGYPGNAASISMLDWTTGQGNAWYWVVKMFVDTLGSGKKDVSALPNNSYDMSLI